jgi:hypothetical protein
MVCEHLAPLEIELLAAGIKETFRGQAWSDKCREWVYFDCYLDRAAIRERIPFEVFVRDHEHLGTHDGQESGFVCAMCHDGIMGVHRDFAENLPVFK